jgi:hypothetical protein
MHAPAVPLCWVPLATNKEDSKSYALQLVDWQTNQYFNNPSDEQRNYTVDDPEAYLYYKAFFTTTTDDEDVLRFGIPPCGHFNDVLWWCAPQQTS